MGTIPCTWGRFWSLSKLVHHQQSQKLPLIQYMGEKKTPRVMQCRFSTGSSQLYRHFLLMPYKEKTCVSPPWVSLISLPGALAGANKDLLVTEKGKCPRELSSSYIQVMLPKSDAPQVQFGFF